MYKSPSLAKNIAIRSADANKPMTFWQKRALNLLAAPLIVHGLFIKKVNLKQYYVVSDQHTRDIKISKDNLVVFTSNEFVKRIGRIDTAKKILRYILNSYAIIGLAITILSIAFPAAVPSWLAFMVFKTILAKSLYIATVFITAVMFFRQVVFPNKVIRAIKTMRKYSKSNFADLTDESRYEVKEATNICLGLLFKHVTGNKATKRQLSLLKNSGDLLEVSLNYRSFADGVKSFFDSNDVILRILRPKLLRLEKNMVNNVNNADLELLDQAVHQDQQNNKAALDEINKRLLRKELLLLVDAFLDFCSMLNSNEYSTEQIKQEMLEKDSMSVRDNLIMSFLSTQEVASS